jgi:hypothetical protein
MLEAAKTAKFIALINIKYMKIRNDYNFCNHSDYILYYNSCLKKAVKIKQNWQKKP